MRRRSLPSEFRPVCQYVMRDGKPQDVKILDENLWHQAGVVYARAHEGEVVYIRCTDGTLRGRITRHLHYISTSALGLAARYREWAEGKLITILAYRPPPVSILGFQVEVHWDYLKELDGLIYKLSLRVRSVGWTGRRHSGPRSSRAASITG